MYFFSIFFHFILSSPRWACVRMNFFCTEKKHKILYENGEEKYGKSKEWGTKKFHTLLKKKTLSFEFFIKRRKEKRENEFCVGCLLALTLNFILGVLCVTRFQFQKQNFARRFCKMYFVYNIFHSLRFFIPTYPQLLNFLNKILFFFNYCRRRRCSLYLPFHCNDVV